MNLAAAQTPAISAIWHSTALALEMPFSYARLEQHDDLTSGKPAKLDDGTTLDGRINEADADDVYIIGIPRDLTTAVSANAAYFE